MEGEVALPRKEWRLIIQLFADDISAAVAHKERRQVIELSEQLANILMQVLKKLGLGVAPHKCNNFIL